MKSFAVTIIFAAVIGSFHFWQERNVAKIAFAIAIRLIHAILVYTLLSYLSEPREAESIFLSTAHRENISLFTEYDFTPSTFHYSSSVLKALGIDGFILHPDNSAYKSEIYFTKIVLSSVTTPVLQQLSNLKSLTSLYNSSLFTFF